ncbi:MAG: radical SAM protein [Magnetococcales bacterium]|nr:radical SAM protein [Magnetococcales bacterium]
MTRLLLIEPPFYRLYHDQNCLVRFPLGLAYLAGAVLRDTTWNVRILNADFNIRGSRAFDDAFLLHEGFANYRRLLQEEDAPIWREVADNVRTVRPTVVGISAKTQNYASALRVARIVKQCDPAIRVILGGPHPTMAGEVALDTPDIDLGVVGEGEATLVELLRCFERDAPVDEVPGLLLRREGRVIRTPSRPFLTDLDALPFPADVAEQCLLHYEHFPQMAFRYVFATRGCPYGCTFCGSASMWSRKVRFRSVENVLAELRKLQARGIRNIHFDDDTFGVKKSHLLALCRAMERELPGLRFGCETSVHLIDPENVTAMQRAGCVTLLLGIESGDDAMLKIIRKNITMQQVKAAIATLRRHGGPYLRIHAFFMVGFPDETEASMEATMRAISATDADRVILSIFTPYPGSRLFVRCQELGIIGATFDHARFNHQSPENCFTARIAPERFRQLVQHAARVAARQGRETVWRKGERLWRRIHWSLRERGFIGTIRKALQR